MANPVRIFAFGFRALEGVEGGIETHARELYPRLAGLSCDITVLTRARYDTCGSAPHSRCRSRPIWAPRGKGFEAAVHSVLCTVYCAVVRPDIVHIHGVGPGVCAALLRLVGLPVVLTHHGHDYDASKWGWLARSVLRIAEAVGVRCATRVICVSDAIRSDIAPLNGQSRTIYNGVDRNPDTSRRPRGVCATLAPLTYVLVVGRITAHKRVLDVVAAVDCSALAGLKVVVCGALGGIDPYVAEVSAAARDGRTVVLAGFVPPPELPWLYRHALCTVMASSYEGMPFAVLEALASGSTVLLSDVPAHREIGLAAERYFPVGDVAELRAKIVGLRREPAERQRNAQAPVLDARFDWSSIARATAAVFEEVSRGNVPSTTTAQESADRP